MKFSPPLIEGQLIKRYKRFLADVLLHDGQEIRAHVPNTGSMKTCYEEGSKVYLSYNPAPHRKCPYTLEMTYSKSKGENNSLVGVNTQLTNKLVEESLSLKELPPFKDYELYQREVPILKGESRIDFLLKHQKDQGLCYLEVKNVTLLLSEEEKTVGFPDSVSKRAQKHLQNLMDLRREGYRCAILYVIQREHIDFFKAADEFDPEYARLFKEASLRGGLESYAYSYKMSKDEIKLGTSISIKYE